MKKDFVIPLVILCLSSCNFKKNYLTGNSCKYWNVKKIERQSGEIEKKENISFKICKNGFIERFYLLDNGDRRKIDFGNYINWEIKEDSLFTGFDNFKLLYITKDSLILGRKGDSIYFKNELRKDGTKIFEGKIKE